MTLYHKTLTTVLLLLVVVTAGCGDTYDETTEPEPSDIIFIGDFNRTGNFTMDGHIEENGFGNGTFRNVTIYLYTENGTLLKAVSVGRFAGRTKDVSISSTSIPTYVIIDSPDFWTQPRGVEYYEWWEGPRRSQYRGHDIANRSELPVDLPRYNSTDSQ